jgi:putative restriction endonuclease
VQGTIAITDYGWYERLRDQPGLEEVNFWKPSATRTFQAEQFSPFLFKLRAPRNAICGFAFFARYSRLPDWLAWECFQIGNGCASLAEMRARVSTIRERIRYRGGQSASVIGCVLLVQPVFFPPERWVQAPRDWPVRTQVDKKYDLSRDEGARIWAECRAVASELSEAEREQPAASVAENGAARYGTPFLIAPRLGQGTFRIAVTEAYGKGCAITEEHSLPALEAGHIRPFASGGPNEVCNGLLLRADLHRLFDQGYMTVTPQLTLEVSKRLREDYANGRTYYPLHGRPLRQPLREADRPTSAYLEWHNNSIYLG